MHRDLVGLLGVCPKVVWSCWIAYILYKDHISKQDLTEKETLKEQPLTECTPQQRCDIHSQKKWETIFFFVLVCDKVSSSSQTAPR